jgi:co-chaperonin GroES (HSP10)
LRILEAVGVDDPEIRAREMELLDHILPLGARVITSKPTVSVYGGGRETLGGVIIPDEAMRGLKEFGMIAWILKTGPDVGPEIIAGRACLIPEYAGKPLYLHRITPYYIVGEGDIMAVILE